MKTYAKGARFERDLMNFLHSNNFACLRCASSGGWYTPVDIIAIRNNLILAIECKAHNKKPKLEKDKVKKLREWCDRAKAWGFLAWKVPGNEWRFLRLEDMEANRYEDENWFGIKQILGVFG